MVYNLTIMTDKLLGQIANPDCSYLVGALGGEYYILRLLGILIGSYIVLKIIDKLAFGPFIDWVKSRIYKKRD